jgi:hypothetical protein
MDQVIAAKYIREGDKCSKAFFCSFTSVSTSMEIHSIFTEDNREVFNWEDISEAATKFFTKAHFTKMGLRPAAPKVPKESLPNVPAKLRI